MLLLLLPEPRKDTLPSFRIEDQFASQKEKSPEKTVPRESILMRWMAEIQPSGR
jgi:hypothetical protein